MKNWTRRIAGAAASLIVAAGLMAPAEASATPFGQSECTEFSLDPTMQECVVWSESMNKHIWVHVRPSATPGNDKVALFLDGIESAGHISDWVIEAKAQQRLADNDVTMVFPGNTDNHHHHNDWDNGHLMYETFYTKELPAFLESHFGVPRGGYGTTGIAGFSMGAYGAMNIASKHPDQYNAVLALSGFYNNQGAARSLEAINSFWQGWEGRGRHTDPGYLLSSTASGDIDLKWVGLNSPWDSEESRAEDNPILHVDKLNMPVIVSTSTGVSNFLGDMTGNPAAVILQGGFIEAATFVMTTEMQATTTAMGKTNFYYHYDPIGAHAWDTWKRAAFEQGLGQMFMRNIISGDGNPDTQMSSATLSSTGEGLTTYGSSKDERLDADAMKAEEQEKQSS